jgi:CBS domain-containing protein
MVHNVVTIRPGDDVSQAAKLLVDHDISALPVVDDNGRVVGILSEADLIRREEIGTEKQRPWWLEAITPINTLAVEYAKSHGRKVEEIMTQDVVSVTEETPLVEIATVLERKRIKRVPVLKDGKLVGIVSRTNLVQALASATAASTEHSRQSDRAIRLELLARLDKQHWTGFGERNVVVANGVVHLWGLVDSPEQRTALRALAEDVPGVQSVSDEMIASY